MISKVGELILQGGLRESESALNSSHRSKLSTLVEEAEDETDELSERYSYDAGAVSELKLCRVSTVSARPEWLGL